MISMWEVFNKFIFWMSKEVTWSGEWDFRGDILVIIVIKGGF